MSAWAAQTWAPVGLDLGPPSGLDLGDRDVQMQQFFHEFLKLIPFSQPMLVSQSANLSLESIGI